MESQLTSNKQSPQRAVHEIVASTRKLCVSGKYKDALEVLEPYAKYEIIETREKLEVLQALARIYVFLGYPAIAKESIRKALQLPRETFTSQQSIGLDVQNAYVTVVACGERDEDGGVLSRANVWLEGFSKEELFEFEKLDIESYICRIALVNHQLHQRKGEDVKHSIAKRLEPIISTAMTKGRFDVIWTLFEPYTAAIGPVATINWLTELLDRNENIPDVLQGLMNIRIASYFGARNSLDDCKIRLDRAKSAWLNDTYEFGELELQRFGLHYGLITSQNVLKDLIGVLIQYCNIDYPLGVLGSSMFPLQRAFEAGHFGTYFNLQRVFHEICKIAGIVHERVLLEIQLLASMNAATGQHGKVIELGEPLYRECLQRKYWTPAFLVAQVLSLAESQVENLAQASVWARKALKLCKDYLLLSESVAAYNLAHILSLQTQPISSTNLEFAEETISLIRPYIQQDIDDGEIKLACEKLSLIATINTKVARADPTVSERMLQDAHAAWDQVQTLAQKLEGSEMVLVSGNCEEARVIQLLSEGRRHRDNIKEDEAIERLDNLISIYERHNMTIYEANKYQMKGMCNLQKWQNVPNMQYLEKAENCLLVACEKFQRLSSMQFLLNCRHQLCRIYVQAWEMSYLPLENCQSELRILEDIADTIRKELSALEGLQALLQKQHFAARSTVLDLYNWAIGVCSHAKDIKSMWLWSQKRKARSLSDMLGVGILMPAETIAALKEDPDAFKEFRIWQNAQETLRSVPDIERGYIRQEIEDIESRLKAYAPFHEYVILRDGVLEGVAQVKKLYDPFHKGIKSRATYFIDWTTYRDEVFMLITHCSSQEPETQLFKLDITVTYIRRWISEYFSTNENRRDCLLEDSLQGTDSPMRQLDALIRPLLEATNPDDLLILSPTGVIFSLPLHCLKAYQDGRSLPLIARNPILYVPSFSVLENCIERTISGQKKGHAVFLSSFDHPREADSIAIQAAKLADSLNGRHAFGKDVTKSTFGQLTQSARLIHFHGHCHFSADNVLQQSLLLTPEQVQEQETTVDLNETTHSTTSEQVSKSATLATSRASETTRQDDFIQVDQMISHTSDKGIKELELSLNPIEDKAHDKADTNALLLSSPDTGELQNHLTLEEMFRIPLSNALVVLVACSSSAQLVSAGDEPLGLISGLLYAGAVSVIGSSWHIPSRTGRVFSEEFYKAFARAKMEAEERDEILRNSSCSAEHAKDSFIDLAVTLQSAIKEMMDRGETSGTFHWAAFSLWGSWGFRADLLDRYRSCV